MNDFLKWLMKVAFQGIVWVFILSINWNGRSMFFYAHDFFVQNALVQTVDEELGVLWSKVSRTARATFSEPQDEQAQAL